jgi:hypothetical protein
LPEQLTIKQEKAANVPICAGVIHTSERLLRWGAGMSCHSVAEEIMPGRADYLVEQRGFKPRCSWRSFVNLRAFPIENQQFRLEFPLPAGWLNW